MTTATAEIANIRASVLKFLEASAATSTLAKSAWIVGGGRDLETKDLVEWITPKVLQVLGRGSRGAKEANVLLQIDVAVRPGTNIHRREVIADAFARALANKSIEVGDHDSSAPATVIGHLRLYDSSYVELGRINGLETGAVTLDGLFTPA